jgi:hypothetical protein
MCKLTVLELLISDVVAIIFITFAHVKVSMQELDNFLWVCIVHIAEIYLNALIVLQYNEAPLALAKVIA